MTFIETNQTNGSEHHMGYGDYYDNGSHYIIKRGVTCGIAILSPMKGYKKWSQCVSTS